MATYSIKRFADPDALKHIQPRYLLALLKPYRAYFASEGLSLPETDDLELDHETLARILMNPSDATPSELASTLYPINEMATLEMMDHLLDAAKAAGLSLDAGSDATPADVAVQVWLKDRGLFERKHSEQLVRRPRSFQSFQSRELPGREIDPSPEQLALLESDLDDWFEERKRGRGCRLFVFPEEDALYFLVRHGQPFKREGSLQGGRSGSVYYRPEKHDIVSYIAASGELRMNAASPKEKDLYRTKFGLRLFASEDHFPGTAKYTLDPLREQGEDSLACPEVEGMQWVKLTEIRYWWGGAEKEIETRSAGDLFASVRSRKGQLPSRLPLIGAKFLVKFSGAKMPRSISIRPPNIAEYTRDDDERLVEQWLSLRGFILTKQAEVDEDAE